MLRMDIGYWLGLGSGFVLGFVLGSGLVLGFVLGLDFKECEEAGPVVGQG